MSEATSAPDPIDDLRYIIRNAVAGGFLDDDEIVEHAVESLEDEHDPEWLQPHAERLTAEALREHRAAQATWPVVTDCDRLDAAFAELERRGIVARQNFSCCMNCGSVEIWGEVDRVRKGGMEVRGCTFYHAQDLEGAVEDGGLYLAYSTDEEGEPAAAALGHEIAETISRHGLPVEWDGDTKTRIHVPLDWKRRRS